MAQIISATIKMRRDTTTNWASINPTPLQGEACYDTEANIFKIGDGSTPYADLNAMSAAAPLSTISGQVGSTGVITAPSLVGFDDFWTDTGDIVYNGGTKRFTVSEDGIYRITMNPFMRDTANPTRVFIGINNDAPTASNHFGHAYKSGTNYDTACLDSVVELSANDYIVFFVHTGVLYNATADRLNQFSIVKLDGVKGDQGIQGVQGVQGVQGIQGDTGDTGDQGIQGPAGSLENIPIGTIFMFDNTGWVDNSTMANWYKCDGNNGTPNLVDKFVMGSLTAGSTGGSNTHTIQISELPTHTHTANHNHTASFTGTSHTHTMPSHYHFAGARYPYQYVDYNDVYGRGNLSNGPYMSSAGYVSSGGNAQYKTSSTDPGDTNGRTAGGTVTVNTKTLTTGSAGSGTAIDTKPAFYSVIYIRKNA